MGIILEKHLENGRLPTTVATGPHLATKRVPLSCDRQNPFCSWSCWRKSSMPLNASRNESKRKQTFRAFSRASRVKGVLPEWLDQSRNYVAADHTSGLPKKYNIQLEREEASSLARSSASNRTRFHLLGAHPPPLPLKKS